MENGTISIVRLQEIVELPTENDGEALSVASKKAETWPSQGSVVFDDVKLQYGYGLRLTWNLVRANVNL
jgi:ABC-type bacteriocin/lantibiotic exporter with double-glycine peptidase domain